MSDYFGLIICSIEISTCLIYLALATFGFSSLNYYFLRCALKIIYILPVTIFNIFEKFYISPPSYSSYCDIIEIGFRIDAIIALPPIFNRIVRSIPIEVYIYI